jgi:hypothetical protein
MVYEIIDSFLLAIIGKVLGDPELTDSTGGASSGEQDFSAGHSGSSLSLWA